MRTDIEIRDDIFALVRSSALAAGVSGGVFAGTRPRSPLGEDIVVSVLSSGAGQVTEAYVNVNVYVADVTVTYADGAQGLEEDSARLRELCRLAADALHSAHGPGFWARLAEQRVYAVEATGEHMINNRLLYRHAEA